MLLFSLKIILKGICPGVNRPGKIIRLYLNYTLYGIATRKQAQYIENMGLYHLPGQDIKKAFTQLNLYCNRIYIIVIFIQIDLNAFIDTEEIQSIMDNFFMRTRK